MKDCQYNAVDDSGDMVLGETVPRLSVIITAYNSEKYLAAAVQSVLDQDFADCEIIVVDDASSDGTAAVVKAMDTPKVRYRRLVQNHGGPSRPRNVALEMARGTYVAFLDADDLMRPGHLAAGVGFLDDCPEVGLVFSNGIVLREEVGETDGRLLDGYPQFWRMVQRRGGGGRVVLPAPDVFRTLFSEQFIFPSGVTARRDLLLQVGMFDETLTNGDDIDMWFRLARRHSFGFLREPLFCYRVRAGSISRSAPERSYRLVRNRIAGIQKQLSQGVPADAIRPARRRLGDYYAALAYLYRAHGDLTVAWRWYLRALCCRPSLLSARGCLLSLLRIPSRGQAPPEEPCSPSRTVERPSR